MTPVDIPPGTRVLIGTPGITMPDEWWPATVLWTDGDEVLVRQGGIAGQNPHNQLHPVGSIRAVGDYSFTRDFQQRAHAETKALVDAVDEATSALNCARSTVWQRLKEIGAVVPGVEEPVERTNRRRREKVGAR